MKLNEALRILKDAITYNKDGSVINGKSWILSSEGKGAIETVLHNLTRLNDDKEEYDFQGWLIEKKTMKNILNIFNPIHDKEKRIYIINDDNNLLDVVPTILQDDGMGYGANNGSLTGIEYDDDNVKLWF